MGEFVQFNSHYLGGDKSTRLLRYYNRLDRYFIYRKFIDKSKNNVLCYTYKSLTNKAFENMAKGHYFYSSQQFNEKSSSKDTIFTFVNFSTFQSSIIRFSTPCMGNRFVMYGFHTQTCKISNVFCHITNIKLRYC